MVSKSIYLHVHTHVCTHAHRHTCMHAHTHARTRTHTKCIKYICNLAKGVIEFVLKCILFLNTIAIPDRIAADGQVCFYRWSIVIIVKPRKFTRLSGYSGALMRVYTTANIYLAHRCRNQGSGWVATPPPNFHSHSIGL